MIRAAKSELGALITRAARGAGYPYGLAQELSEAALTLCALGEDGARAALRAIRLPIAPPTPRGRNHLFGTNVATLAPAACDLAPITISGPIDRALLAGYLAAAGLRATENSEGTLRLCSGDTTRRIPPPYDVAKADWDALTEIASAVLVPDTGSSAADAGSQLSDND